MLTFLSHSSVILVLNWIVLLVSHRVCLSKPLQNRCTFHSGGRLCCISHNDVFYIPCTCVQPYCKKRTLRFYLWRVVQYTYPVLYNRDRFVVVIPCLKLHWIMMKAMSVFWVRIFNFPNCNKKSTMSGKKAVESETEVERRRSTRLAQKEQLTASTKRRRERNMKIRSVAGTPPKGVYLSILGSGGGGAYRVPTEYGLVSRQPSPNTWLPFCI